MKSEQVKELVGHFWSKVNKDGPIPAYRPDLGPCWLWTGEITNQGYGMFMVRSKPAKKKRAHRFIFEAVNGPLPEGMVPDHLCRVGWSILRL